MTTSDADTPTGHSPHRAPRRRVRASIGLLVTLALVAGGAYWVYSANATETEAHSGGQMLTGTTDTITLGDLEGNTTVTGTLRFSGARSIHAGFDGTVTALAP